MVNSLKISKTFFMRVWQAVFYTARPFTFMCSTVNVRHTSILYISSFISLTCNRFKTLLYNDYFSKNVI